MTDLRDTIRTFDRFLKRRGADMPDDVRKAAEIALIDLRGMKQKAYDTTPALQSVARTHLLDFVEKYRAWKTA